MKRVLSTAARLALVTAGLIGLQAVVPAEAQVTSPPKPDSRQTIPEKEAPPLQSGRSDSLTNKLNKSNGVIKPNENVDPAMRVPAPDPTPNSMPVIPPGATGNSAK